MMDILLEIVNSLSDRWVEIFLRLTWQGAIFIGIIFFITQIFHKMPAYLKHILWFLVIVKFLIAPFFSPVGIPILYSPKPNINSQNISDIPSPVSNPDEGSLPLVNGDRSSELRGISSNKPRITLTKESYIFLFWLTGVLFFMANVLYRFLRLRHILKDSDEVRYNILIEMTRECADSLKLKGLPRIMYTRYFTSPLSCGIIRPTILLPEGITERLSEDELKLMLYHELGHIKRLDMLTNWFQLIVQVIHFYNPLIWYVNRKIRLEREIACDDLVLHIDQGNNKAYADTLVKIVELTSKDDRCFSLGIVGVSEPFINMKSRLIEIMKEDRRIPTKLSFQSAIFILLFGLLSIPLYSNEQRKITAEDIWNHQLSYFQKISTLEFNSIMSEKDSPLKSMNKFISKRERYRSETFRLNESSEATTKDTNKTIVSYDGQLYQTLGIEGGIQYLAVSKDKALRHDSYMLGNPILLSFLFAFPGRCNDSGTTSIDTLRKSDTWVKLVNATEDIRQVNFGGYSGVWLKLRREEGYVVKGKSIYEIFFAKELGYFPIYGRCTILEDKKGADWKVLETKKCGNEGIIIPTRIEGTEYNEEGKAWQVTIFEIAPKSLRVNYEVNDDIFTIQAPQDVKYVDLDAKKQIQKDITTSQKGDIFTLYLEAEPNQKNVKRIPWYDKEEVFRAQPEPVVTDKDITYIKSQNGDQKTAGITINFKTSGRLSLSKVTKENINKRLAVVIDGKVISAPVIKVAISSGSIFLHSPDEEVLKLFKEHFSNVMPSEDPSLGNSHEKEKTLDKLIDEAHIIEIARAHLFREKPGMKQVQLGEPSGIDVDLKNGLIDVRFPILSESVTEEVEKGVSRTTCPTAVVQMDFTGKLIGNIQRGRQEVERYIPGKIERTSEAIDEKPQSQPPPQVSSMEIFFALRRGDMVKLRKLLNDNPNLVTAKDNQGYTLLHQAAVQNQKEAMELLVSKGADINEKDSSGETPLHFAARYGNKEVVEFLLIKKSDVNIEDNEGYTPLHLAAWGGRVDVVRILLTKSVNINAKSHQRYTPLYLAVQSNSKEVVEIFLSRGADVNARFENGWTLLHQAVFKDFKDISELLLSKGADINAEDNDHLTPLYWAVNQGREEVAVLLINKGADVNVRDEFGWTPLHFASKKGHKRIVKLLLSKGSNVNARLTATGETPLHLASKEGHIVIADLLLSTGADVNARDTEGRSPLRGAMVAGKKDVAEFLREHGGEE